MFLSLMYCVSITILSLFLSNRIKISLLFKRSKCRNKVFLSWPWPEPGLSECSPDGAFILMLNSMQSFGPFLFCFFWYFDPFDGSIKPSEKKFCHFEWARVFHWWKDVDHSFCSKYENRKSTLLISAFNVKSLQQIT